MTTTHVYLRGAPSGPYPGALGAVVLHLGDHATLHISDRDDARALATLLLEAAHQLDEAAA